MDLNKHSIDRKRWLSLFQTVSILFNQLLIIRPICLYTHHNVKIAMNFIMFGWNATRKGEIKWWARIRGDTQKCINKSGQLSLLRLHLFWARFQCTQRPRVLIVCYVWTRCVCERVKIGWDLKCDKIKLVYKQKHKQLSRRIRLPSQSQDMCCDDNFLLSTAHTAPE